LLGSSSTLVAEPSWAIAQAASLAVSLNLVSPVRLLSTVISKSYRSLVLATSHGPAEAVVPVLIPLKPFPKSLFVFSQVETLSAPPFTIND